ncbi:MAG TPA: hypothetical protein PKE29_13680 [Phycisphaerales bacterium]|nr:hypothetical protein [Phycisphaerales bacterium]
MPIDNATLLKRTPPPPPPPQRRPRPWWVAPLIFIVGAAVFSTAARLAWGDLLLTRIVVVALMGFAALFALWRMLIGWQEGGLLGVLYRRKHPTGTMLAGDEERDGVVNALWVLACLAVMVSFALWVAAPGAFAKGPAATPPAPQGRK